MSLYEKKHIYYLQVEIKDDKPVDTCSLYLGCCIYKDDRPFNQWTQIQEAKCTDELRKAIEEIIKRETTDVQG